MILLHDQEYGQNLEIYEYFFRLDRQFLCLGFFYRKRGRTLLEIRHKITLIWRAGVANIGV